MTHRGFTLHSESGIRVGGCDICGTSTGNIAVLRVHAVGEMRFCTPHGKAVQRAMWEHFYPKLKSKLDDENVLIAVLLRDAVSTNYMVRGGIMSATVLRLAGHPVTDDKARSIQLRISELQLIDSDHQINHAGREWLDSYDILAS